MLSRTEIKKRVRRGADLLRRHSPDWYKKIDPGKLSLRDPENDLFAQVFGSFKWAVENLFSHETVPSSKPSLTSSERWAYHWANCMCDHGFEPWDEEDVKQFTEEWLSFSDYLKNKG